MSAIAALILAEALGAQGLPGPLKIEVLAVPRADHVMSCADRSHWALRPVDLKARCVTAADGRIAQCTIISDTETNDPKVEEVALCVASHWRVHALDTEGKPVIGAPVGVPIRFGVEGHFHKAK